MKNKLFSALLASLILFTQCNFQKIGRDTGKGFNENSEAIARNLMAGVNQGLSDPAFQKNLNQLIDSLVGTAGGSTNKAVKMLMDSILTDRLIIYTAKIVEEATGQKLKGNVAAITDHLQQTATTLLGPENREKIRIMVATAIDEILNDKLQITVANLREEMTGAGLRNNMSALRDSLLNDKTNAAIKNIVDTAMLTIAYRMKNNINPSLQDNLSFIQKNASTLLITLGIIALVIIVVVWRLKQKYAKMTTVVASQIYAIPDQNAYDDLTARIKEKATLAGVEPTLRKMLEENGLLGKDSRESWQTKKAAILQNKN